MSDPLRPEHPLAITRAHLFALGALSLSLAVLSFFVGLQVGRNEVPPPAAPPVAPLVSDQARSGELEVLLANVERSQGGGTALGFPSELPRTDPPPVAPVDGAAPVPPPNPFGEPARVGAATVPPGAPVASSIALPEGGWSIQVGSRDDEGDAVVLVDTLRAAGLSAYKVVALVDGKATWRVRVGGFATKEAAGVALPEVASRAGAADAVVTPAP